jgi:hypothetical protein
VNHSFTDCCYLFRRRICSAYRLIVFAFKAIYLDAGEDVAAADSITAPEFLDSIQPHFLDYAALGGGVGAAWNDSAVHPDEER